jgi:hypothetical protein
LVGTRFNFNIANENGGAGLLRQANRYEGPAGGNRGLPGRRRKIPIEAIVSARFPHACVGILFDPERIIRETKPSSYEAQLLAARRAASRFATDLWIDYDPWIERLALIGSHPRFEIGTPAAGGSEQRQIKTGECPHGSITVN